MNARNDKARAIALSRSAEDAARLRLAGLALLLLSALLLLLIGP